MAGRAQLERDELDIGYVPTLCAAPLILALVRGTFEEHGLRVNLQPASCWSGIKELMAYDTDGILAPEPYGQIPATQGTGFIHLLSKQIWNGHPCCSFG